MSTPTSPEFMDGFHLCEPQRPDLIENKVDFLTLGHIVVADVDLTLTTNGHTDEDEDVSSWGAFREQLSADAKAADDSLYRMFRKRERENTLTLKDSEYWWNTTLGLYVADGVYISAAYQAAHSIHMRDGAVELSHALNEADVPEAWLSAGIRDVLELLADFNNVNPDVILATKLISDPLDGRVTGWDPTTLVHPYNKNEQGLEEITRVRRPDPESGLVALPGTILLGDSTKDPNMVEGEDVLRIRVSDPHMQMPIEEYIAQSREAGYDLVIKEQGLWPVISLVKYVAKLRGQQDQ
jgi:hypothetical protein